MRTEYLHPTRTGLFWLLAPKAYLPATAVAGVLVTR
jgi:hypothetical protein